MEKKEVVEDFLSVDQNIPGQNYVCLSFVSPEKILKNKNNFYNTKYLHDVFNRLNSENKVIVENINNLIKNNDYKKINEDYENFKYKDKNKIEKEFYEKNNYRTTVRGLKIRGVYDTHKEAEIRAKRLQRSDSNFNVYVAQVGYWLAWNPDPDSVQDQKYQNKELNTLIQKYNENRVKKDIHFEDQKRQKIEEAQKENLKRKMENSKKEELKNILLDSDPWSQRKEEQIIEDSIKNLEDSATKLSE